jgi:hypothetical protein
MNLDELQHPWRASTRALVAFPNPEQSVAGRRLSRRRFGLGLALLADLLLASLCGAYLVCRGAGWRFALPGAFLLTGLLGLCAAHLRQFAAARRIDPGQPLLQVQRRCLHLHLLELRTTWAIALGAPLAWPALLVVGLDVLGVDAYDALPRAWLWANLGFGLLWVPLLQLLGRGLARWRRTPPRLRAFAELATGKRLSMARRELGVWQP